MLTDEKIAAIREAIPAQFVADFEALQSELRSLRLEATLLRNVATLAEKKPWLKLTADDYRLEELINKWHDTFP